MKKILPIFNRIRQVKHENETIKYWKPPAEKYWALRPISVAIITFFGRSLKMVLELGNVFYRWSTHCKFKKNIKVLKSTLLWTSEACGAQGKTVILVCMFLFRIQILFVPLHFYLSIEAQVLKFFYLFFYLHIFTDKKYLNVILQSIPKFFLLFGFVTTLCSFLPPSPYFLLK